MPDELVTTPRAEPREHPVADDVVRAPSSSAGLNARGGSLRRLVGVSDALALVLAFLLSGLVAPSMHGRSGSLTVGLVLFAATLPAWLVGARLTGLYRLDERRANGGGVEEWLSIGRLMVIGTWAVLAIAWVARFEQPQTARLVVFATLAVTFAACRTGGGAGARPAPQRLRAERGDRRAPARSASSWPASSCATRSTASTWSASWTRRPSGGGGHLPRARCSAPSTTWRRSCAGSPSQRVIVAFSQRNDNDVLAQVRPLAGLNVHVDVVPRMFEMIGPDPGCRTSRASRSSASRRARRRPPPCA